MSERDNVFQGPWTKLANGLKVLAAPNSDPQIIQDVCAFFNDAVVPTGEAVTILKRARQRRVLRLKTQRFCVIAKLFPLKNPSSILRHRKYARREYANYLRAISCGIETPKPIAFLEYRAFGFVRMSGIIIEDIGAQTAWFETDETPEYLAQSQKRIPALVKLFNQGVNHIDARDENLLCVDDETVVIDWQYACFITSKAPWLLEHFAAYYIRNAPIVHQQALKDEWLVNLHSAAKQDCDIATFKARVKALMRERQSVSARMSLRPVKVTV